MEGGNKYSRYQPASQAGKLQRELPRLGDASFSAKSSTASGRLCISDTVMSCHQEQLLEGVVTLPIGLLCSALLYHLPMFYEKAPVKKNTRVEPRPSLVCRYYSM